MCQHNKYNKRQMRKIYTTNHRSRNLFYEYYSSMAKCMLIQRYSSNIFGNLIWRLSKRLQKCV